MNFQILGALLLLALLFSFADAMPRSPFGNYFGPDTLIIFAVIGLLYNGRPKS